MNDPTAVASNWETIVVFGSLAFAGLAFLIDTWNHYRNKKDGS